ncbi:hypothetical protein EXE58_02680 [Nocardioides seonyuensis]|uniref:DUF559 domain-containing protein n=1 Tax=Nocardioides seonyuensis TaxID=2518371 RepID=A0A4P7ICX3_9ACTN|nr:hypothetical protein [Nocardioides seonyuensis]QBX54480.1 hypothetical protein EXE58_02680 [Nocardioides seonyuensis]
MDEHRWASWQPRPHGLIAPVGLDPAGRLGPTRNQARGPRWRQTSSGRYVPATADATAVHQRILEQGTRIRDWGAVTGWAGLRWRGARFFEGSTFPDGEELPVPLVIGSACLRPDARVSISSEQLAPRERELVDGIWVATAERALFDEVRRHGQHRQAVVDIEMAVAAGLLTMVQFRDYIAGRQAWTGVGLAREAAAVAGLGCRTPQEVRMALVWILDAGLPRPMCNAPVFDLEGHLLAIVDLLDVEAECVGEYQGADHKDGAHHRRDVAREQRLRDAGLECFEVVGGDLADRDLVVERMLAARQRSAFRPLAERRWTLEQPSWWAAWAAERGL